MPSRKADLFWHTKTLLVLLVSFSDLFRLCPQYVMRPQLRSTCHYTVNRCVKLEHVRVVRNVYTISHFFAHFTQTCSIMRADEKFLAIVPCMLGLLPEHAIELP